MLVVLLLGGLLLGSELLVGWFAYDEGALGQSAERVLRGEVPHRDFDEIYTGLLTYLHAAVFAVFGPSLVVMRLVLYVASMAWLWAMYRIALRFAPPLGAGLVALAAFTWSVPNYTAAMPSWYILFVATFGALALVRWHETGAHRWIMLAGAAGGVAFLFKLSGVFFLLGGGLALLAAGPVGITGVTTDDERPQGATAADVTAERIAGAGIAALLVAMVLVLARFAGSGDREMLRHVLPTALVALAIAARFAGPRVGATTVPWRAMLSRLGWFAVGAAVPITSFVAFYALVGGLGTLFEGVFVTPFRRLDFARMRPPEVASLALGVPLMTLLWSSSVTRLRRWIVPGAAAVFLAAVLVFAAGDPRFYRLGWFSAWGLLFFLAIESGRQLLVRDAVAGTDGAQRGAAISLACVAIGLSLIEYPYAPALYTLYALPLTLLAIAALMRATRQGSAVFQVVVACFFLAFGWMRLIPTTVQSLGRAYTEPAAVVPIELARGGLYIRPHEAVVYERLIPLVTEIAAGRTIWAGPDAPEIYFLSELPNRTRTLFDFLDPAASMTTELVARLDALGVAVIVLKLQPPFSPAPTAAAIEALRGVFPNERVMTGFLVLWR
ncbi:MAG: hypothetical protein ACYC0B_00875 [Gemmatimonadaceae bacterium]